MVKKIAFVFFFLIVVVLFWLYYTYNPNLQGLFFPKCPSYTIFKVYCPGCGSQRAIHHLLHFQLEKAFQYNPLMIVLLPLVVVLIIQKISRLLGAYFEVPLFRKPWFSFSIFVLVVLYFILRNIPLSCLDTLRPPL